MQFSNLAKRSLLVLAALALFPAQALSKTSGPASSERHRVEALAERIAGAIYNLDYLDPGLAPVLVEDAIVNAIDGSTIDPASKGYLREILDTWFFALPNINSAIGPAIDRVVGQSSSGIGKVALDKIETAAIPRKRKQSSPARPAPPRAVAFRGRHTRTIPRPPRSFSRRNSDYP